MNNNLKQALKGLMVYIFYIFMLFAQALPFQILNIDLNSISNTIKMIYTFIYELFILAVIVFIYYKDIKKNIVDLKNNHKKYFSENFKYWLLALGFTYIANIILFVISGGISTNEEAVRSVFEVNPLYMFFSALIFAPVVEELVFRHSFRKIFKTDFIYIIISGITFGLLHVVSSATTFVEFLYFIPYSIPGMAFAYMVFKTKNVLVPINFHMFHNGLSLSLYVFLQLFS